jgi:hypothetical protein
MGSKQFLKHPASLLLTIAVALYISIYQRTYLRAS